MCQYIADQPMAVSIAGAIHGGLFLLYCLVLLISGSFHPHPIKWGVRFFVAALIPFGPFVEDKRLKLEIDELTPEN